MPADLANWGTPVRRATRKGGIPSGSWVYLGVQLAPLGDHGANSTVMVVATKFFRLISPIVSIVSSPIIFWQGPKMFWQGPGGPESLPND